MKKYMYRALQLAASVNHSVAPNPMVGAVIVYKDQIIGEGYHARCGEAHAEVNAIRSVKNPSLLTQSTLYVTLEPCSHYGKTPPCAELIIEKRIPRVVVGCYDPFPEVSGRGIRMLQQAGIEVEVGMLEEECKALNKRFITFHTQKRPYILLKWAQTADGFIDFQRESNEKQALKISSSTTQTLVHKMRSEAASILVGTRTALLDNPSLTTRYYAGKTPLRIAIDRSNRIPDHYHLKDGSVPTWIITEQSLPSQENLTYLSFDFSTDLLPQLLSTLYQNKIQSLLVEGGSHLLNSFLEAGLWDEITIEVNPMLKIENGIPAPHLDSSSTQMEISHCDEHIFMHYYPKNKSLIL